MTRVNDSVNVTCEAKGRPTPTVTWYVNDVIIDTKSSNRGDRRSSELVINGFKPENEGVYKCVAKNSYGDLMEKEMKIGGYVILAAILSMNEFVSHTFRLVVF